VGDVIKFPYYRVRKVGEIERLELEIQRIYQETINTISRERAQTSEPEPLRNPPPQVDVIGEIFEALDYAFESRDWDGAKKKIDIAVREARIRLVDSGIET
jgi:hypothetical protein